jgi:DNA helicase-2/ATP-dependent DNA helicase PcrA
VGNLKFLYSDNNDVEAIKNTIYFQGWDFKNSKETKELYLTHNLIAPKAGFLNLMAIYDKERIVDFKNDILKRIKEENIEIDANDTFGEVIGKVGLSPTGVKAEFISQNSALYEEAKKYKFEVFKRIYLDKDQLIGNKKGTEEEERRKGSKRDALIRHLFHIQECIFFYEHKKFNQFIRATGFHVSSIQSKIDLKKAIETLKGMKENTIEAVIEFADVSGLWTKG